MAKRVTKADLGEVENREILLPGRHEPIRFADMDERDHLAGIESCEYWLGLHRRALREVRRTSAA